MTVDDETDDAGCAAPRPTDRRRPPVAGQLVPLTVPKTDIVKRQSVCSRAGGRDRPDGSLTASMAA